MRITTLIENNHGDDDALYYEHGLSLYIETNGKRILFDTGQTGRFIYNANKLHKDIVNVNHIVVSHGHYDHSGGIRRFFDITDKDANSHNKIDIVVGNEFFNKKYKVIEDGEYRYNGIDFEADDITAKGFTLRKIEKEMEYIEDNVVVFHSFKQVNNYEIPNKKFVVRDNNKNELDLFQDEIVLGVITDKGLVVIVGCSHVGIVNILSNIQKRIDIPIYAVIGGTHLIEAEEHRIRKTADYIDSMNIQIIAVSHCTGSKAMEELSERFGERFVINNTGKVIVI